jgi:AcrR family transcriptional regulator
LLDAVIDCLVEEGYAKTTTRSISQRAGVSPGALQHHFPSKTDLLAETVRHIRERWVGEMVAQGIPSTRSTKRRYEQLLDRMWGLYRGPLFQALIELTIGGHRDAELSRALADADAQTAGLTERMAPVLYPELAGRPELVELIITGQATMRGLALLALIGDYDPDATWPTSRSHIMAMNAHVLGDASLAPSPRRAARLG